jgi:hypothetical protein
MGIEPGTRRRRRLCGRGLANVVRNYDTAFSNLHLELYQIYADGNVVVVQLALQGTLWRAAHGQARRRQDQTLRLLALARD